MALVKSDLFSIVHYDYGEAYYGSIGGNDGMRFRVAREPFKAVNWEPPASRGDAVLRVTVWPEPDSWRTAPQEAKITKDFPYSDEGLQLAADWLNEMHDSGTFREKKPGPEV